MMIWLLTLLVAVNLVLTGFVFRKVCCKSAAQKLDELVERAQAEDDADAQQRSRRFSEGIENVLSYEVHGMDGFGGGV